VTDARGHVLREQTPGVPGNRVAWVDVARGLGILLVVYGHALRATYHSDTATGWPRLHDTVLYSFHMPLFFVLSGLFLWPSLAKGAAPFARGKLVTIVWPYLLWSLIEGGLQLVLAGTVNTPMSVRDLLLIPVRPLDQFWFLYALFVCQIIALAVYPRRFVLVAVAMAGFVATWPLGVDSIWFESFSGLPYVIAGVFSAATLRDLTRQSLPVRVGWLGLSWSIFVALFMLWGPADAWHAPVLSFALGASGCLGTILLASLIGGAPGRGLAALGSASMAIYVMHVIFAAAARVVLKRLGVPLESLTMLGSVCLVGVAVPYVAWRISTMLGLSVALGLGDGLRKPELLVTPATVTVQA